MYLEIISPDKVFFKGETDKVSVPGMAGSFTVLPGHAAIVSLLVEGDIVYLERDSEKRFNIISGMIEVKNDKIVVCVDKRMETPEEQN
ncbi:MAG: F0F1 ATP synthase subunit epsilon [Prevotellaceae bacterium]|jgi:F-type H+-transporting ATPase subunit epsilon|nr:F0F1 ATP synthase subunit epsilon [Prevotellaceae bacterium]